MTTAWDDSQRTSDIIRHDLVAPMRARDDATDEQLGEMRRTMNGFFRWGVITKRYRMALSSVNGVQIALGTVPSDKYKDGEYVYRYDVQLINANLKTLMRRVRPIFQPRRARTNRGINPVRGSDALEGYTDVPYNVGDRVQLIFPHGTLLGGGYISGTIWSDRFVAEEGWV